MATMQECETIEKIAKIKNKAKREGISADVALSGGKEYYRKVIASVRNSGIITMTVATIIFILELVYTLYSYFSTNNDLFRDQTTVIGVIVAMFLIWFVMFELGYKICLLESTPRFILGCLIINFAICLIFCVGIFPIVAEIFGGIALARWSTYKDWFYNFGK